MSPDSAGSANGDGCPFCAVVAGEAEATRIHRTERALSLVPRTPDSEGHLLVIPVEHHESLFDIPESALAGVMAHARSVARALRAVGFDGANVLHASGEAAQQSVFHFHLHLAPRRSDDDLDFWPAVTGRGSHEDPVYDRLAEVLDDTGTRRDSGRQA